MFALRQSTRIINCNTVRAFSTSFMLRNLPKTQKAFTFVKPNVPLELKDIPVVPPAPGHVLIKLEAAGVCHSDLHLLDGMLNMPKDAVLGHEIVGTVAAVGEGLTTEEFPIGSLYSAHGPNPCGRCSDCRAGKDNICQHTVAYGLGLNGGYEQFTSVYSRNLIKVPDGIPLEIAAVTTDAVLTPYHAFKKAGINGLSKILIIGIGGLGCNAVQLAKALGAHVTAFDMKKSSRDLAKAFGADVVLESLTLEDERKGYDFVADIVGVQATFDLACKQVKAGGIVIPIGLGSERLSFDQVDACIREVNILGSFWGTSLDQVEVFELVKRGLIKPQVETADFKDLNKVLDRLKRGEVKSRVVLKNFNI